MNLRVLALVLLTSPAFAQGLVNGGFDSGLASWTAAPFGAPAGGGFTVAPFDIDGVEALATSDAARVVTGTVAGATGPAGQELRQDVALVAGVPYRLRVGWAAENLGASGFTFNALEFRASIPGVTSVWETVGPIGGNATRRGVLLRDFSTSASGTYTLTLRVSRIFEASPNLVGWIDDVELGVQPLEVCFGSSFNGCPVDLETDGIASASSRLPMTIEGSVFPNARFGLFFYGTELAPSPFNTYLCAGGTLRRMPVQSTGGSPAGVVDCSGATRVDFNPWIQSGVDPGLQPGSSVYLQFWFRDTFAPNGYSFSDTLHFVVSG